MSMRIQRRVRIDRAFVPLFRLDVFDRQAERKGKGKVKIAEVLSDGISGEVNVIDSRFADLLQPMFTNTAMRVQPVEKLAPFGREALEHALNNELPIHNLRGELVLLRLS